jgi:hypothetical protein
VGDPEPSGIAARTFALGTITKHRPGSTYVKHYSTVTLLAKLRG